MKYRTDLTDAEAQALIDMLRHCALLLLSDEMNAILGAPPSDRYRAAMQNRQVSRINALLRTLETK